MKTKVVIIGILGFILMLGCCNMGVASIWKKKVPLESKYLAAVLPFENLSGKLELDSFAEKAGPLLLQKLHPGKKFRLIEIQRIGDVLNEMDRDLFKDRQKYLSAVRKLGAELVILGQIESWEKEKVRGKVKRTLIVEVRLVNLLNGEIISMFERSGLVQEKLSVSLEREGVRGEEEVIGRCLEKVCNKLATLLNRHAPLKK